jgi:alcohol dehydrogenase class IV
MKQQIFTGIQNLEVILNDINAKQILLVCGGKSYDNSDIKTYIDGLSVSATMFRDFSPNPKAEDAQKGVDILQAGNYDAILAVGGGSPLDVAKYIKQHTDIPLIAIPTTAGSGSESTHFAVIYANGEKTSVVSGDKLLPAYVVLEPSTLESLPLYQKKCTIIDALVQAIESYWSVKSTEQSRVFSEQAIKLIMKNLDAYIAQDKNSYTDIMVASNLAGQAINIAQTTAAHAMSYKITSMTGLPHGHAVGICLPVAWEYMQNNMNLCHDPRGIQHLEQVLSSITKLIDLPKFKQIINKLELHAPTGATPQQIDEMAGSVNAGRLGNFPIALTQEVLKNMYTEVFGLAN